ncbi:1-deoxy-D-xylulose-5-phosphate synthase [Gossypium arboreum]|uniref:1-deoxy-D-xylulose-5-phosphate synthase n=1 Tax=Gossypium arboreum TaxID=29729 RepID=A0A0B0MGB4_GOSAR|nr:1-deoxy-D-xylulose-5-phosphate synthase [Gossypium arboreum]
MTRLKPCHTQSRHTVMSHGRVPAEPKLSPIRERPLCGFLPIPKPINTHYRRRKMETEKKGKELTQGSRLIHLRSRIHHQD